MNLFVRKRTVKASNKEKIKGHDIISNTKYIYSVVHTFHIIIAYRFLLSNSVPSGNVTQAVLKGVTTRFAILEKLSITV